MPLEFNSYLVKVILWTTATKKKQSKILPESNNCKTKIRQAYALTVSEAVVPAKDIETRSRRRLKRLCAEYPP